MEDRSTSRQLRTATAADHAAVDAAFGSFDLADADAYRRVLAAHAAALLPAEAALAGAMPLRWRPRAPLLLDDLAALGVAPPPPLAFAAPGDEAGRLGLLYVLEGSRLGNGYLARTIPADRPSRYMAARHERGEWRALLALLDQRGVAAGQAWIDRAIGGAHAAFALYARAAAAA